MIGLVYLSFFAAGLALVWIFNGRFFHFKKETAKLASLFSDQTGADRDADKAAAKGLYPGKSQLEKTAHSILANVVDAETHGLLQDFDVDSAVKRIRGAAAATSSWPRTLAGILIIVGLVVTLFNLRESVGHLENVFENMRNKTAAASPSSGAAQHSDDSIDTDALQNAMAGIASAATLAFGFSAMFISLACGLLTGSFFWGIWMAPRIVAFEDEAMALYFRLVPARHDQGQIVADLAQAVENLQELSDTFKQTNDALLQIGSFGTRFEDAAKEISEAVSRLPAGMRDSMSDLSGSVAREIANELQHYIEHIKHIEAIYGDQQVLLTNIVKAMSNMEDDWRKSSDALVSLGTLPDTVSGLKTSVDQYRSDGQQLNKSVTDLRHKVDALPVEDLSEAAQEMREIAKSLSPLVSSVQDVSLRMKELVAGTIADSQRDAREQLMKTLEEINSKMTAALQTGLQNLSDDQKVALANLSNMANSVTQEVRRLGGGQTLLELALRLQRLGDELSRIPKWPRLRAPKWPGFLGGKSSSAKGGR